MTTQVTATAADGTLWHIAARVYGNPLAAIRIAQLSGITDPWLSGTQTLTLPGTAGADTGGLPAPGTNP